MRYALKVTLLSLSLLTLQAPLRAQTAASELSAISMLPVAVSVAAPLSLLGAGLALTVVAVEATANGTLWVLERASDGARASLRLGSQVLAGTALAVGTVVAVTVIASGYVLVAAGQVIAFVPNETGTSLLYNERVTR